MITTTLTRWRHRPRPFVSLVLLMAIGAAGCSGGPSSPSAFSSGRRVQGGGGGGEACVPGTCEIAGTIEVNSNGDTVTATTSGEQSSLNAQQYTLFATLQSDGRFGTPVFFSLAVANDTATVTMTQKRTTLTYTGDSSEAPASFTETSDASCAGSGIALTTTVETKLSGFGPVSLVERHCER